MVWPLLRRNHDTVTEFRFWIAHRLRFQRRRPPPSLRLRWNAPGHTLTLFTQFGLVWFGSPGDLRKQAAGFLFCLWTSRNIGKVNGLRRFQPAGLNATMPSGGKVSSAE